MTTPMNGDGARQNTIKGSANENWSIDELHYSSDAEIQNSDGKTYTIDKLN